MNVRAAIDDRVRGLYENALVWDNLFAFLGAPYEHLNSLALFRTAGVNCVTLTLASDRHDMPAAMNTIATNAVFCQEHPDDYVLVRSVADIHAARADGKLALVWGFQGTRPFGRSVGFVEMYYRMGIRQALMAYNQRNHVGDGCHELTDAGLSRFGVRVVQEMNRVGMIVDCTHTGYRTTMDVFEAAEGPVIFSHSNSKTIWDHPRNIRDDQAVACAQTGGVVGLCGDGAFLPDNDVSTDMLFRQVDYYCGLLGEAHVGVGMDYFADPGELMQMLRANPVTYPEDQAHQEDIRFAGPGQLVELADVMLSHGYTEAAVRGVLGENWLRVANTVWK